jgi:hypothetical protein
MHAARTLGGRLGRAEDSAQKLNSNKKAFFSFQNSFINYKSILIQIKFEFHNFCSQNKIQEHFITPRKICNGMNVTNNYLFKYIAL